MIGINLAGQLGNQMFRYACARALGEEILEKNYKFRFINKNQSILNLNILRGEILHKDLILSEGTLYQKLLYIFFKIIYKFIPVKDRNLIEYPSFLVSKGICLAGNINHFPVTNSIKSERIFLDGTFENPMYFPNIRSVLLREFTPTLPLLEKNRPLFDIIENTNSVCISIRRGDFLTKENRGWFDVCNKQYYLDAIAKIRDIVEHPVFILFSNDITWVRENIQIDGECYYESGNDPVWETLRLMYSCKHFIISNSTFHWWAQYLCRNEEKVVVAPSRWNNSQGPYPLILDSFIKIKV